MFWFHFLGKEAAFTYNVKNMYVCLYGYIWVKIVYMLRLVGFWSLDSVVRASWSAWSSVRILCISAAQRTQRRHTTHCMITIFSMLVYSRPYLNIQDWIF